MYYTYIHIKKYRTDQCGVTDRNSFLMFMCQENYETGSYITERLSNGNTP